METSLPFFLYVQYVNSSKYCKYPFLGPLCTILETTLAIDFNLKVSTIFVEYIFFEVGLVTIHCPSPSMVFPSSCWSHAKVFFGDNWSINLYSYGLTIGEFFKMSCKFKFPTSCKHNANCRGSWTIIEYWLFLSWSFTTSIFNHLDTHPPCGVSFLTHFFVWFFKI